MYLLSLQNPCTGEIMPESESKIIELHFPLRGETLAADHGYFLYAAACNLIPEIHGADWLGIHTIKGHKHRDGVIAINSSTKLRVRLPSDKVTILCKLAGTSIELGAHSIQCGVPEIHLLKPAKRLRSRLVMIKCKDSEGKSADDASFQISLQRQIASLGVSAQVILEQQLIARGQDSLLARRVMKVKAVTLTGYGVILDNLNERDSLLIQEKGLGGKRRMGCGLFDPLGKGE